MFFPNRKTGGKDTFRVSCGLPTTRSLVLFGLINREFVDHHFAISRRSLLRSEMATLMSDGKRVKAVWCRQHSPWLCTSSVQKEGS